MPCTSLAPFRWRRTYTAIPSKILMIGHQGRSNATPCSSGGPKQTDGTAEIPEGGSSLRTVTKEPVRDKMALSRSLIFLEVDAVGTSRLALLDLLLL